MSHVAFSRTALLLTAVGCNSVYGLDRTELIDAAEFVVVDTDEDGVLDVVDVCPEISNSLQEDMDGDRLGDACDPCPTGSNHNEDGDALLDGCDNCPHVPNDDQANADNDELGDACDLDNENMAVRTRFDGFDVLGDDWIPGSVEWAVDADTIGIVMPASDNELGLWNRRVEVVGSSWMIETHFRGEAVDGVFGGIRTRHNVGTQEYLCYVQYDDTGWRLGTPMMTSVNVPVTDGIRLRVIYTPSSLECEANGVTLPIATNVFPPTNRTHPGLTTSSQTVRFDYIEAVSTPDS